MPPFVEVGGSVWIVEGWDYGEAMPDRVVLRRLSPDEQTRFELLRLESEIELHQNFVAGG